MTYLTLEEIKKQCVIDEYFTEDDEFLEMVGDAAEDFVSQMIDCPIDELVAQNGDLPATVRHAMRMMVDYYYSVNRGSADADKDIPKAVILMLKLYRNY